MVIWPAMRTWLILLLAIVLPLKSMAAAAVSVIGSPLHAPAMAATDHTDAHCDGAGAEADTPQDRVCPHLAMLMLAPPMATLAAEERVARAASRPERAPPSVVLDVLLPPPTA